MILNQNDFKIIKEKDNTKSFIDLFEKIKNNKEEKNLVLEKGIYYFNSENATTRKYFVTNTIAKSEYKREEIKNLHRFFIFLENIENLEIDGSGSTFIFNGIGTNIAIINSKNIKIKNLNLIVNNPNSHTFKVIKANSKTIDFKLDDESRYEKIENKFYFVGKDYKTSFKDSLIKTWWACRSLSDNLERMRHPFLNSLSIKEIDKNIFRVKYIKKQNYKLNEEFTIFENRRIEQGILSDNSENIVLENIYQNFSYGLSTVFQNTKNVDILNCRFAPRPNSQKAMSSCADFIQISMCSGKFNVKNNYFEGSGDDVLNIHGFHFKIKKYFKENNSIIIRHSHRQTYGFLPFIKGEKIAFINRLTLLEEDQNIVKSAKLINDYDILLELEKPFKYKKLLAVENVSRAPSLHFDNNSFKKIATRGLLITTRGKVLIENNNFISTSMHSILISNDARTWFESSKVEDISIKNNTFNRVCGYTLQIMPENIKHENFVHKNILFENNKVLEGGFYVKSADNVKIINNKLSNTLKKEYIKNSNCEIKNNLDLT